jgi:hypothetical protein
MLSIFAFAFIVLAVLVALFLMGVIPPASSKMPTIWGFIIAAFISIMAAAAAWFSDAPVLPSM